LAFALRVIVLYWSVMFGWNLCGIKLSCREWSLRLKLTQHGKTYQERSEMHFLCAREYIIAC
jgi:hypothetical protein